MIAKNNVEKQLFKEFLKHNKIEAKISLGQNFIYRQETLKKIAGRITDGSLKKFSYILEVGPGTGNLTEYLLDYTDHLWAVEIDKRMVDILNKRFAQTAKLEIFHTDIRKIDLCALKNKLDGISEKNYAIAGNLPYYLTTELIIFLTANFFTASSFLFLIQKDVTERILAKDSIKAYGPLGIYLQNFFEIELLDTIQPPEFYPEPNIISQLVKFKPKLSEIKDIDLSDFYVFLKEIFQQRRKQVLPRLVNMNLQRKTEKNRSELSDEWTNYLLEKGYDSTIRVENFKYTDFIEIYQKMQSKR